MPSYPTPPTSGNQSQPRRGSSHFRYHQLLDLGHRPFCAYCEAPLVCCERVGGEAHRPVPVERDEEGCFTAPQGSHFFTLDHVVPRCAGGPDTLDNLLPACSKCNNRKGTRPLLTFLAS